MLTSIFRNCMEGTMSIILKFKNATLAFSCILCATFSNYAAQAWVHSSSTGSSDIKTSGCIFNVENYGANGADNNLDRAAIQAAIEAARINKGGTVFLPAGNYFVDSSLFIGTGGNADIDKGNNVSIVGEGRHLSTITSLYNNDVIVFRGGATDSDLSTNNTLSDFSIHKTIVRGVLACQSGGAAVAINRASGVLIRNLKVWNYSDSVTVRPRFTAGIAIRRPCDEVRIYYCFFKEVDTAIVMDGNTNSTTICDNFLCDSRIHIYAHGGAGSRIINNTMGNATITGIKIFNSSSDAQWINQSLLISANEMEGNGAEYDWATKTHYNFKHNEIWIENENPGKARGLTISNNYFNLAGMRDSLNNVLYTPYDVYNATQDQIREITFHNNVYTDYDANPRSEGLSIGKTPNAEINLSTPLSVKGNVTVDGKIGVGTENPQAKLNVVDNTTHTQAIFGQGSTYSNDNSQIMVGCPTIAQSLIVGYNHTEHYAHLRRYGDYMGSQSLNIALEGKIGIGVTNPGAKLEVNGDVKLSSSSNKILLNTVQIMTGNAAPPTDNAPNGSIYLSTGGGGRMYVRQNGSWIAK